MVMFTHHVKEGCGSAGRRLRRVWFSRQEIKEGVVQQDRRLGRVWFSRAGG